MHAALSTARFLRPKRAAARPQMRSAPAALLGLLFCCACLDGGFAGSPQAGEPALSRAEIATDPSPPTPSPMVRESAAALAAPVVALRTVTSNEIVLLLTQALQEQLGHGQGRLELQLLRPWTPVQVPDEPLQVLLRELPATGLSPQFILRFELRAGDRSVGLWQTAVQARLWREVWVARTLVRRGTPLREAELVRELRDVLTLREPLADLDHPSPVELETCDVVPAGAPILARAVRPRPVIRRGQLAEAVLQDGALRISLKVEALEDGAPGQIVRVRNPVSRRDLYGRVVDSQTVQVSL